MATTIQIRVDDELKARSDDLFRALGTDTTTAVRMFLTQAVAVDGFPFEIRRVQANPYRSMTEKEILARLESSRAQDAQGLGVNAREALAAIKEEYGL